MVNQSRIPDLLLFVSGILCFAVFVNHPSGFDVVAFAGLLLSAIIVSYRIKSFSDLKNTLGFGRFTGQSTYYLVIAILAGLLLGMFYRDYLIIGPLPYRLTRFAITASLIGATEELLFRGYLQTQARRFGVVPSILVSTVAHTAYKFLLFSSMNAGAEINLTALVLWTLLGGVVFGLIREFSKNTSFPMIAHVVFDIVVYGDRSIVPWWIWS